MFLKEFFEYLKHRKKLALLPIVVVLFLLGVILFLGQSSVVAPFLYSLF